MKDKEPSQATSVCEIEENATGPDQETVFTWLREFNLERNREFMEGWSQGAEEELFLVARDREGRVIGGLSGTTLFDWLKISIMAVAPECRRQGIGRRLMETAEEIAAGRGCRYAYVDSMSYQGPDFYLRLGFDETGRLPDWDSHGHDKIFFMKHLQPGDQG